MYLYLKPIYHLTQCFNGVAIWILIVHYAYLSYLNKGSRAEAQVLLSKPERLQICSIITIKLPFVGCGRRSEELRLGLKNKRTSDHRNKEHCSHCSSCCPTYIHPFLEKFLSVLSLPEYSCCWLMNAAQNSHILL